ncbi:MAG: VCBS repeat-containing protein, partial [Prevotella sp.]|nr:VCBS repeat-containing protein [Prevotella sp.]
MKTIYTIRRLTMTLLLLQAVMTPIIAAGDTDPVGTPKGSFSVSPTGGANYTVSFNLPDIKTSLVPSLGIAYNSQSGNGMAGWGCNITGISVITRGLRDYYHDGEAHGITHTSSDALYLDGRRLILDSGTAGTAGAVYLLEGDPFTTVTASSGSYGLYFSVHTSDGLDYEYGNSSSSRQQYYSPQQQATVTNAWYVNGMTNALDDYITFSYQAYSYTLYPYIILYGNSQTGREATVTFTYETRNDTQDYWIENVKGTMDRRLSGVTTKKGNATYRSYELTYNTTGDASGMKFSRLTTVTEKNGSGEALRPITLTWDYLPGTAQSVSTPPLSMTTYDVSTFTSFDINGDGIDDVIHAREDNDKYYVNVYKSSKSGNTVSYTSASCEFGGNFNYDKDLYRSVSGLARVDFDGDGLGDILVPRNTYMGVPNAIGFSFGFVYGSELNSSSPIISHDIEQVNISNTTEYPMYVPADFNSDGKTEIFCMSKEGDQGLYCILYYFHINANGSYYYPSLFPVPDDPQKLFTGDYNNDGMTDIIVFHSSGYKIFWNNGGTDNTLPFDSIHVKNVLNSGIADVRHIHQGDFNGDGLTDFLLNEEADSKYYFALSNGDGTFLKTEACDLDIAGQATAKDDNRFTFLVYDIDHDGRSDLVLVKAVYHNSGFPMYTNVYHRTAVRWLTSTGTALVPFRTLTFDGDEDDALARNLLLGDFTGNGQVELMNNGRDLYTNGTNPSFGGSSSRATLSTFVDDTRAEYDKNDILSADNDSIRSLQADSLLTGSLASASIESGVLRSSPSSFRLYRCTDMTPNSGKVTSVTDGLGNVTGITYKSLSDPTVYTRGTGASYPVADITVPLHVVSTVNSGNGAAGTMTEY